MDLMRSSRSIRVRRLLVFVVLVMIAAQASATVTQVDGTIVPTGTVSATDLRIRMQAALDTYELPAGTINAVRDASEVPQIFQPNLSQPVVFQDIRETAGFENSFGYYNVGDDVQTVAGRNANLHPIMGCGVPMVAGAGNATTHSGNPAAYILNAEEGAAAVSTIGVNFASEQLAGRYKGGFIGFYLITPETNPSSQNCGDFKTSTVDGKSLFGFIYFTQKDLNNDGDFVHHLVYPSPLVANRFYFGFEDLFRGGDNDFEDMAMRVDGLTPPCVPQAEICDGLDNDCDGLVDVADPDLIGVNSVCTCDGVNETCDNGPRFGQCQSGVTTCTAGAIVCHGTGTPTGEICDNLDNNCNNQIDDNPAGTGAACDGTDADSCPEGQIVCQSGALVCNDNSANNVELCNGVDDDCNGQTDEGNPGGGGACGSSIGVCTPGTFVCSNGALVCTGSTGGSAELCNGLDDDCDGVIDDSPSDVGQQCGATNEGECAFGQTICVGGSLSCAGEVGPSVERCNNLDDDCDGTIDEDPVDAGQPCGSSIGACSPGAFECSFGTLACTGGTGPTAESCNGTDDDCDAKVDEQVPGEGVACGAGMGPCSGGATKCISGAMECVGGTSGGTETCNAIDDDCDGNIDEGDLCDGGICDNGVCASPCIEGEFPCPTGKKCETGFCVDDPCFAVQCPADAMGNAQSCSNGVCQALCLTVTCPNNLVCRGVDGVCVPDTCEYLPKCAANEICVNQTCVANPCQGVTCPSDEFCRAGACVTSCEGVQCSTGQVCKDGTCTDTGCPLDCGTKICHPDTHTCEDSLCSSISCPPTQVCDPFTGACVPDPCQGVDCPGEQACSNGQCGATRTGQLVTTGGGGGCAAGGGDGSIVVVLIAAGLLLVRRRHVRLLATGALAGSLSLTACSVNEYCLQCALVGGDGGNGDGGDGGGSGSGGDGGMACDPNQIRPETCNHADDDCDGNVDEATDKQNDELNCGECGVECNKPGAQTKCQAGACIITGCFPGFNDENGDTTGPYATSDGCEYTCFTSNGGVEACDTLDNDCDGNVDEGIDKTSDVNNCGACGKVCDFFEATGHCTLSTCTFDPAVDCSSGHFDVNGDQADGCEYQCTSTNGGIEACDVLDNDCDGRVDETFTLTNDPNNCGRCGLQCQFPHATASCSASTCGFNPATDCQPGFVDSDGNQLDGCEYPCSPTNGGIERCDGIDNDCDGVADDSPVDAGGACSATSPPTGTCVANGILTCASGQLVCSGATEPVQETCDNLDNDCDGTRDDNVSQVCYTGTPGTSGIGRCRPGFATCSAGTFGACTNEVTPTAEQCNNLDDDCDGAVDNGPGSGPITQSCYGGPAGTDTVGTCQAGTKTCAFGAFGTCAGEIDPRADLCGDNLDTDCDGDNDTAEGCLTADLEFRLDAGGGGLGESAPGNQHSYDVVVARGGAGRVYATWSQLVGAATEVYFRSSTDGGKTWGTIINVTAAVATTAVKPTLAVAPGATDRVVVVYQTVTGGVRDIRVQVSTDSGGTFGAATAALDGAGDSFHHAVAISGSTVVVTWEKLDTATLNRDVQSRTSTDGGVTFGSEIRINVGSPATRFAGRPQVGITSTGGVVWVWREQRAGATRDMFAASVATATATPAADIRLDNDSVANPALQTRDSDFPVLTVVGTSAYLVWQDVSTVSNGGSDVLFVRSTNGGVSWSAERIIDDPAVEVSSSFTPTLAVDPKLAGGADDFIAIAWEDRRQGTQIFASTSSDGGASFTSPLRASSENGAVITGATSIPVIAAAGNGVLVVAYQNQQTNSRAHVFVASSIDSGATWTLTHTQLDQGIGAALAPQIAPTVVGTEPGAAVVWTDFRAGNAVNGDVYTAVSH